MVERVSRIGRRTELQIGLLVVLVGVLVSVIGQAVDAGRVLTAGLVVLALGVFAVLGIVLPRRNDGTRLWQTDQGTSSSGGAGGA